MVEKLEGARSLERLTYDKLEVVDAPVKIFKVQVKEADEKNAKIFEDAAQVEGDFSVSLALLESSFIVERDRVVRLGMSLVDEVAEKRDVRVNQQEAFNAVGWQLEVRKKALQAVRASLTAAASN